MPEPTPFTESRLDWVKARWKEGYRITSVAGDEDPADDRVTPTGRLLITNKGYITRKGKMGDRFSGVGPENAEEQKERISRVVGKASAIEALSRGCLPRKVLRGSPTPH